MSVEAIQESGVPVKRRLWTEDEDKFLLDEFNKGKNWKQIAEKIFDQTNNKRTWSSCKHRWLKLRAQRNIDFPVARSSSKWTSDELEILEHRYKWLKDYDLSLDEIWRQISIDIKECYGKERTPGACRKMFGRICKKNKYFTLIPRNGFKWSVQEGQFMVEQVRLHGMNWQLIARKLETQFFVSRKPKLCAKYYRKLQALKGNLKPFFNGIWQDHEEKCLIDVVRSQETFWTQVSKDLSAKYGIERNEEVCRQNINELLDKLSNS